jgi:hypothetical protein
MAIWFIAWGNVLPLCVAVAFAVRKIQADPDARAFWLVGSLFVFYVAMALGLSIQAFLYRPYLSCMQLLIHRSNTTASVLPAATAAGPSNRRTVITWLVLIVVAVLAWQLAK